MRPVPGAPRSLETVAVNVTSSPSNEAFFDDETTTAVGISTW